jgi:hypothetical protein
MSSTSTRCMCAGRLWRGDQIIAINNDSLDGLDGPRCVACSTALTHTQTFSFILYPHTNLLLHPLPTHKPSPSSSSLPHISCPAPLTSSVHELFVRAQASGHVTIQALPTPGHAAAQLAEAPNASPPRSPAYQTATQPARRMPSPPLGSQSRVVTVVQHPSGLGAKLVPRRGGQGRALLVVRDWIETG